MHVAFFPFPMFSHPPALFSLARAMAAGAPDVTFSFLSTSESLSSLSKLNPDTPENLRFCHVAAGKHVSTITWVSSYEEEAAGILRAGIEAAEEMDGGRVTSVVSDAFHWMAADLAEEIGVPWVAVWIGGIPGLVAHLYTDTLRDSFGHGHSYAISGFHVTCNHPNADESISSTSIIPCLSDFRLRELPEYIISDVDSPFPHFFYRITKQLPRAAAVVTNTMQGLDPKFDSELAAVFKKYLPIGPFDLLSPPRPHNHTDDDECIIAWLDLQDPSSVAYVSFGTYVRLPPSELAELAHGLEASGGPFLWALRDRESLPDGFIERTKGKGMVVDWAPQTRVLAHGSVGVFLSHCGSCSVMETISAGVPMICRPGIGDQVMTARMVCDVWKIGLGFSDGTITREELVGALSKILKAVGDEEEEEDQEERMIRERNCKVMKSRALREVAPGGTTANNLNSLLEIIKA